MSLRKTIGALTVLTSLIVGAAPQSGVCSMSQIQAVACAMPCCKSHAKAPACPMIRPAVPHDAISTSSFQLSPNLKVVAIAAFRDFLEPLTQASAVFQQPQVPKATLCSTP